jgi:hypothetical protein
MSIKGGKHTKVMRWRFYRKCFHDMCAEIGRGVPKHRVCFHVEKIKRPTIHKYYDVTLAGTKCYTEELNSHPHNSSSTSFSK